MLEIIIIGIVIIGVLEIWNYTKIKEIVKKHEKAMDLMNLKHSMNGANIEILRKNTDKVAKLLSALLDYLQIKGVTVDAKPEQIKFVNKKK